MFHHLNYWGPRSLGWGLGGLGFEYTPIPDETADDDVPKSPLKRWLMQEEGEIEPEGPVEPKTLKWGIDKAIDNLGALEVLQSPAVDLGSLFLPPPVSIPFWAGRKFAEYGLTNQALEELGSPYSFSSAARDVVPFIGKGQERIHERIGNIMGTVKNVPDAWYPEIAPTSASGFREAMTNYARQDPMQNPGYQDVGGPGRLDAPSIQGQMDTGQDMGDWDAWTDWL
jgi:hypothetical protein